MKTTTLCKVLALSLSIVPVFALAQQKAVEIMLEKIVRNASQEESGDELYFSITEYSNITRPEHYQVPNFPTHWLSNHLKYVKDVRLWSRTLQPDESVVLIISLVERDVPPWNVDDLIGSVKFKVSLKDNKIIKQWSIPNKEHTSRDESDRNSFSFTGDNGDYDIVMRMREAQIKENN